MPNNCRAFYGSLIQLLLRASLLQRFSLQSCRPQWACHVLSTHENLTFLASFKACSYPIITVKASIVKIVILCFALFGIVLGVDSLVLGYERC